MINAYVKTIESLIINKASKKIEANLSDDQHGFTIGEPSQQYWRFRIGLVNAPVGMC